MPDYFLFLLAGVLLAVFSEKIDQLTGGQKWIRQLIGRLAPLLILIGMAKAAMEIIFFR